MHDDPDLVARELLEAVNRRDFSEFTSLIAPDAVLESMGMGTSFEGVAAIRGFFEDWTGAYEEYGVEPEEILDLGNGVAFGLDRPARPSRWRQWSRPNAVRNRRLGG